MAENLWQKGKLTAVMYPAGTHENNGEKRYQRAPFDVLNWIPPGGTDMETFLVPVGHEFPGLNLSAQQDEQLGMEFGYYTGEQLILETYQAGGQDVGWRGVHTFGPV